MNYRHKNVTNRDIMVYDSKMTSYLLEPGKEIVLDKDCVRDGIILIPDVEKKEKIIEKKTKGGK